MKPSKYRHNTGIVTMSQKGAYEVKDDSISELELVQRVLRTESNTSI